MPFNGAGIYTPPSSPGAFNPAQAGGTADPQNWNALLADISSALSTMICNNGQSSPTQNIPFNSKRITNVANPVNPQDAATMAYVTSVLALRGYIDGLTLSAAGGSSSFGIAAGEASDSTSVQLMSLPSAYTKSTSAWQAGAGNGGLDAGSIATNAWYGVFLIINLTSLVVDVIFTREVANTPPVPTLPSGYTLYRYIGSILTDGSSNWKAFVQNGDQFAWNTPPADISSTEPPTTAVTQTLASIPLGVKVQANLQFIVDNGGSQFSALYLSDLATADIAPGNTFTDCSIGITFAAGIKFVETNTSAQIRSRMSYSDGSTGLTINTLGWTDSRGKNA